jgi:phenylacetate-CoA ligase
MRSSQPQRVLAHSQQFFQTPLSQTLQQAIEADPQAVVLQLFKTVLARVPGYGDFLKKRGIEGSAIQTFADFKSLPLLTKSNYVQHYPLAQLCWDGLLEHCDLLAVSSGSTGAPTFWPRFVSDEYAIATRFEQVFRESFQADHQRTLAVVCFPMGTWVGGLFTTNCCRHLAAKGYPLTVIAPGNNPREILRIVGELGSNFEQVVLLGYPPFVKDIVDSGLNQGIDWSRLRVKLVFAGEVFNEEWRTLLGERLGSTNFAYDSASLYGTADAGVLGNETPLSITIRRYLSTRPDLSRELFGESRLPTLVQYDPTQRFFEVEQGTLLFSGDNGIPLIRYHIADKGGIVSYASLLTFLKAQGFDPLATLGDRRGCHALPFVYVFSRSLFVLSFYGANIYPETIALGLEQPSIRDWVTGKFVMEICSDDDGNSHFAIAVELALGVAPPPTLIPAIADAIKTQLLRLNSEFAHYVPSNAQTPEISLHAYGDPAYFPQGVKHRYART